LTFHYDIFLIKKRNIIMKQFIQILIFLLATTLLGFGGYKKIVVDLTKQEAYAYEDGKLVYSGWISSGRKKFKTPTGRFRILQKEKEHISNEWPKKVVIKNGKKVEEKGGAKMPYMMRLTWSGIALHEGYTPNYPASHGCIRVAKGFAKKLYNWATIGTRVIVKGKAPRWVARVDKRFRNYYASKKSRKIKYLSARKKLINHYAKYSFKRLNRILRKNYRFKKYLLASDKYSYEKKVQKLKEIKWIVKIIKQAKQVKYRTKQHKVNKVVLQHHYGKLGFHKKRIKSRRYKKSVLGDLSVKKYPYYSFVLLL